MAVIQKIGQNTFNKTWFNLVSKITDVPVRQNKRLNFCDCVVLENTEGRKIKIYSIEYTGITEDSWGFKVVCSRGTYVRALARDIAKLCETVASVDMIRRTQTNGFDIKSTVKLDFLENMFNNGADFKEILKSIDFGLGDIPVLNLDDKSTDFYKHGGFIKIDAPDGIRRVYNGKDFVGIGVLADGVLRPKRTI